MVFFFSRTVLAFSGFGHLAVLEKDKNVQSVPRRKAKLRRDRVLVPSMECSGVSPPEKRPYILVKPHPKRR